MDKLSLLKIRGSFLVNSSENILDSMRAHEDRGLKAFSVDVTDLNYSLPHAHLLKCVETKMDELAEVKFSTAAGISFNDFLALVKFYLI